MRDEGIDVSNRVSACSKESLDDSMDAVEVVVGPRVPADGGVGVGGGRRDGDGVSSTRRGEEEIPFGEHDFEMRLDDRIGFAGGTADETQHFVAHDVARGAAVVGVGGVAVEFPKYTLVEKRGQQDFFNTRADGSGRLAAQLAKAEEGGFGGEGVRVQITERTTVRHYNSFSHLFLPHPPYPPRLRGGIREQSTPCAIGELGVDEGDDFGKAREVEAEGGGFDIAVIAADDIAQQAVADDGTGGVIEIAQAGRNGRHKFEIQNSKSESDPPAPPFNEDVKWGGNQKENAIYWIRGCRASGGYLRRTSFWVCMWLEIWRRAK